METLRPLEVLNRVMRRVEWDKYLVASTIQIEVQPGSIVILRGSVSSPVHKQRAAELVLIRLASPGS